MGEDLRVALLDLPVVREGVEHVLLFGRTVFVRAIAGVVVLEERHGPVLPGQAVGRVAHQADAVADTVEGA